MSKARDLADSAQEINILDGKSFLDEDNLASDSATGIASQQSIKAYVDGITTTNITSTGALNSGSITSGFGNIDNGSSTITTTGAITGGSFVIGSADINENDLESIDGITAGTVSASKAVVVNTNKDITGFRNLTATGTITGSLSGTLSGSLSSTTTATTQAESDDSTKIATTAYVTDKITTLIGGAPSTLNDLNELAAAINDDANYNSTLTTALATKLPLAGGTMTGDVLYNDNVKAKFGAGSDLQISHDGNNSLIAEVGTGNLHITAQDLRLQSANNQDTIKCIQNGAVTLYYDNAAKLATTSTGIQVTGNITNASGNLTLDVAGELIIDADSSSIVRLKDAGTEIGLFYGTSSDFYIKSQVADKDLIFQGNDNGSTITALTLDMSAAGAATFNGAITSGGNITVGGTNNLIVNDSGVAIFGNDGDLSIGNNGTIGLISAPNGDITLDTAGVINLDSAGSAIFKINGTTYASLANNSGNAQLFVEQSNKDFYIKGNDGGTTITALTLDMSEAGAATFNGDVNAPNFNSTSDATLKTNVETLTGSLDAVKSLRGVSFDWIESGGSEIGVIAQEVENVLPNVVNTNEDGIKSVKYGNMVAVLIEAMKEQQAQIDELKTQLNS